MAQTELDRHHAATPFKLQKARDRGQVARSPDVISAIVFTVAMVFLAWQGRPVWRAQLLFDRTLLTQAGRGDASLATLWPVLNHLLRATMVLAAPFLATLLIAALVGNLIQTGPVLSTEPLKPDWNRLNPLTGVKRIFSVRTLFVAARSGVKLLLLGTVAYFSLKNLLPQFHHLSGLTPLGLFQVLLDDFSALGLRLAAMLVLIALVDLIYVRREFARNMRMSAREMKDETKHRDGDPRIRARLRQLRKEMLKRSLSLARTRDADVLITNPTHIAIALRYEHGAMHSPQLVAKGRGYMAAAMRDIAARHRIPVVQSPSLARSLYRDLGIDQHVQPNLYAQVARIIVWVFARRDAMRALSAGPTRRQRSAAWTS